ncbi:MAG TPA: hypothetical protein VM123_09180 [archaeon]|nr:hypothetical protein [archaeon]
MGELIQNHFLGLADNIIAYLPNLFAGIILVLFGLLLGWFIKRLLVRLSIVLRLERFLVRSRWTQDFSKADVRYGVYNFIGNIGFLFIFLLFFNSALSAWKLEILSALLGRGINFLPHLIVSLFTFGVGWLIASWSEKGALKVLRREDIPRSSLISRFIKIVLLLFFSAMALVELNVAHEVVIIGFASIFITLCALTIVITAVGGKAFVDKIEVSLKKD